MKNIDVRFWVGVSCFLAFVVGFLISFDPPQPRTITIERRYITVDKPLWNSYHQSCSTDNSAKLLALTLAGDGADEVFVNRAKFIASKTASLARDIAAAYEAAKDDGRSTKAQ